MPKHTIKGFVTSTQYGARGKPEISFQVFRPQAEFQTDTVVVCEHEFEVEIPEGFDPRVGMVKNLEEQKEKAKAEFAATVRRIDQQIQSLLAIEHTP